ncbi:MAG: hypothetical protein AB7F43_04930 [Bacteriovoracia bacterium]
MEHYREVARAYGFLAKHQSGDPFRAALSLRRAISWFERVGDFTSVTVLDYLYRLRKTTIPREEKKIVDNRIRATEKLSGIHGELSNQDIIDYSTSLIDYTDKLDRDECGKVMREFELIARNRVLKAISGLRKIDFPRCSVREQKKILDLLQGVPDRFEKRFSVETIEFMYRSTRRTARALQIPITDRDLGLWVVNYAEFFIRKSKQTNTFAEKTRLLNRAKDLLIEGIDLQNIQKEKGRVRFAYKASYFRAQNLLSEVCFQLKRYRVAGLAGVSAYKGLSPLVKALIKKTNSIDSTDAHLMYSLTQRLGQISQATRQYGKAINFYQKALSWLKLTSNDNRDEIESNLHQLIEKNQLKKKTCNKALKKAKKPEKRSFTKQKRPNLQRRKPRRS